MGLAPCRTFHKASSASGAGSIEVNRHPVFCAQPDESFPMITVETSAIVDWCSANTPLELATPIDKADVVIEPAAEHAESMALRQITATSRARFSGVHSAT